MNRVRMTGLALVLAAGLSGCSGSDSTAPPASATPDSPFVQITTDAGSKKAVGAYRSFAEAAALAQQKPDDSGVPIDLAADFTRYSVDPVRSQMRSYVAALADSGQRMTGTPPTSDVTVSAVTPESVTLTDCPVSSDWTLTGEGTTAGQAGDAPAGVAVPGHLATVTVVLQGNRWGVSRVDVDTARSC